MSADRDAEFWAAIANAGKDVLASGKQLGYGAVTLEIKFADGVPMVVIANRRTAKRYLDTDAALQDIARTLNASQSANFKGEQHFTVAFDHGNIRRVVVDEAASQNLS